MGLFQSDCGSVLYINVFNSGMFVNMQGSPVGGSTVAQKTWREVKWRFEKGSPNYLCLNVALSLARQFFCAKILIVL